MPDTLETSRSKHGASFVRAASTARYRFKNLNFGGAELLLQLRSLRCVQINQL